MSEIQIGPTDDDVARYGKIPSRRVAKPVKAANDNRLDADRMAALALYREQPDHPYEPLASNWSLTPSGITEFYDGEDGEESEKVFNVELEREIKPSISHILKSMAGEWEWYAPEPEPEPKLKTKAKPKAKVVDEPTKKIGTLTFSNGKVNERMLKTGPDGKLATYLTRTKRGSMLGASEEVGAPKGGGAESSDRVEISNSNITHMMMETTPTGQLIGPSLPPRKFIPKGTMQPRITRSKEQDRALLAEAIANTAIMPPVTICPKGVASGTAKYSDQFIGMKPKATGKSGAIAWVDFYTAGRDRAEWLATLDAMDGDDRQVLESAMSADNYTEVGVAAGQSEEYARRKGGKMALVAANDNLAEIITAVAA